MLGLRHLPESSLLKRIRRELFLCFFRVVLRGCRSTHSPRVPEARRHDHVVPQLVLRLLLSELVEHLFALCLFTTRLQHTHAAVPIVESLADATIAFMQRFLLMRELLLKWRAIGFQFNGVIAVNGIVKMPF